MKRLHDRRCWKFMVQLIAAVSFSSNVLAGNCMPYSENPILEIGDRAVFEGVVDNYMASKEYDIFRKMNQYKGSLKLETISAVAEYIARGGVQKEAQVGIIQRMYRLKKRFPQYSPAEIYGAFYSIMTKKIIKDNMYNGLSFGKLLTAFSPENVFSNYSDEKTVRNGSLIISMRKCGKNGKDSTVSCDVLFRNIGNKGLNIHVEKLDSHPIIDQRGNVQELKGISIGKQKWKTEIHSYITPGIDILGEIKLTYNSQCPDVLMHKIPLEYSVDGSRDELIFENVIIGKYLK